MEIKFVNNFLIFLLTSKINKMFMNIYINMQKQNIPVFTKVISLGNWCGPAYYLKHRGWKTESYPFDWNFETLESVRLCFQDDFTAFLDKDKTIGGRNVALPGHSFGHLSPKGLHCDEHYQYYVRCIERLRKIIEYKGTPLFFVIPRPHSSTLTTVYTEQQKQEFFDYINKKFPNAWLLFCEQKLSTKRDVSVNIDPTKRLITCIMELQDFMPAQQWSQQGNWDLFKKMFDSIKICVDPPSGKVRPPVVGLEGHETL